MKAASTVDRIRESLGDRVVGFEHKSDRRVYIDIVPRAVLDASRLMFLDVGARFQIATGVDTRQGFEVLYHWALDAEDCVVTIRVLTPHEKPVLDSIANVCPAAEWIEREMWELLGIDFVDHPDLRHLLLADDWPDGKYPLRKDRAQPGGTS